MKNVMLRMLRVSGGGAGEVGMCQTGHVNDFELNSKMIKNKCINARMDMSLPDLLFRVMSGSFCNCER